MDDHKILKFIKGELSSDEKNELLDWLNSSSENKEYYRKLRNAWDLLLITGSFDNSSNNIAYEKIKRQIKIISATENKFRKLFSELLKMTAIIAVTIAASWFFFQRFQKEPPITYNSIDVPAGQRVQLTLPDSTRVWLNCGTRFTYPSSFSKKERTVLLNGEARFTVSHNEKCPFIVKTSGYSVKVLGTKFNVYAYTQSDKFETTLMEGSVTLVKDKSSEELNMKPGQHIVYDKKSGNKFLFNDENIGSSEYDWTNGYHNFNKVMFSEMLERLSNYYGYKFTIKNPKIATYECTGKFKYNEDIAHILNVVKISKPFKYKINNNEIIIY